MTFKSGVRSQMPRLGTAAGAHGANTSSSDRAFHVTVSDGWACLSCRRVSVRVSIELQAVSNPVHRKVGMHFFFEI